MKRKRYVMSTLYGPALVKYRPGRARKRAIKMGLISNEYERHDLVLARSKKTAVSAALFAATWIGAGGIVSLSPWIAALQFVFAVATLVFGMRLLAGRFDSCYREDYRQERQLRKQRAKLGLPVFQYPNEEQYALLVRIIELSDIQFSGLNKADFDRTSALIDDAHRKFRAIEKARRATIEQRVSADNQAAAAQVRLRKSAELNRIEAELSAPVALPAIEGRPATHDERSAGRRDTGATTTVYDALDAVLMLQPRLTDRWLQAQVEQIGRDVRALFIRAGQTADVDVDALATEFREHLTDLRDVLQRVIDIGANPRYYQDPQALLAQGNEAVRGFAEYVTSRIRRLGDADVTNFKVKADILSAQELR